MDIFDKAHEFITNIRIYTNDYKYLSVKSHKLITTQLLQLEQELADDPENKTMHNIVKIELGILDLKLHKSIKS